MQDDLVLLESLDPPLMAHCLRHRYQVVAPLPLPAPTNTTT